jgi:hypothetical protein
MGQLTTLISIEDAGHAHEIQWHSELGIGLDVQWLLPRETRSKAGVGVLTAGETCVGDVEQFRRDGRWWERVGEADAGDEVLMDHALAATRL